MNKYILATRLVIITIAIVIFVDLVQFTIIVQSTNYAITHVVMCGIILCVLLVWLSLYIIQSIKHILAKPIRQLVQTATAVQKGDYSKLSSLHKLDIEGSESFSELTLSIVNMVNTLRLREKELSFQARYHKITHLPNRQEIIRILKSTAQIQSSTLNEQKGPKYEAKHKDLRTFVILIRIRSLNEIKHTLGQDFANQFLIEVAHKLALLDNETSITGHIADDTFAIIDFYGNVDIFERFKHSISSLFQEPLQVLEQSIDAKESVGFSNSAFDRNDPEELIRQAEAALYRAEKTHLNYAIYDPDADQPNTDMLSIMGEMHKGMERGDFQLFFQPKIDIKTLHIIGAEALIRWFHPERGFIAPNEFIPLAEKTGRIHTLSWWVIDEALKHCHIFDNEGLTLSIAINLSVRDITNMDMPSLLKQKLNLANLQSHHLSVEVTESGILENDMAALHVLNELQAMGIKIAIDDFGTGQSSLAYLKKLPVSELKIDQTFIRSLCESKSDKEIVKACIRLGQILNMTVTAEGVENEDTLNILNRFGCDIAQGYHIAKPLNAKDFIAFATQWQKTKVNFALP